MSLTKNKTILELYGLPGAGKSTLAKELEEKYGAVRIAVPFRTTSRIKLVVRYPKTFFVWLNIIWRNFWATKNFAIMKYNFSLLFSSLEKIMLAEKTDASIIVLDEGLLQRFLSYSDVVLKKQEIALAITSIPIKVVAILVNNTEPTTDRFSDTSNVRAQQSAQYLEWWKVNQATQLSNLTSVLLEKMPQKHFSTRDLSIDAILNAINS